MKLIKQNRTRIQHKESNPQAEASALPMFQ